MLTLRNKSVNVSRVELLQKLKENLEVHKKDFIEAVKLYQDRLGIELLEAWNIVTHSSTSYDELKKVKISFGVPISHEDDYIEIIEMLEMSVDEHINLDSESFKAYIKNEWMWTPIFRDTIEMNKTYIASKLGLETGKL